MSSAPRILLTGTYCSLNRGDAAMQLACAEGLRQRIPGVRIAIHTPFPNIDTPFYERRGLSIVRSSRRRLVWASWQWARFAAARPRQSAWDAARAYPPESEHAAIANADLVVDLSGDMLTEDYGLHVAYSHYLPPLQALAANVPLAVCAQSVGPFGITRALARQIFDGAAAVTLRESRSSAHLAAIGAEPPILEVTADLSFTMAPAAAAEVDAALGPGGMTGDGPRIGISLSGLIENHRARAGLSRSSLAEVLGPALKAMAEEIGATLVLIPHVYGPKPLQDDRRALKTLRGFLGDRVTHILGEHDPEVLKGIISRCDLFIGARMHAVMAALSTTVPVIALAYSHKAVGIMGDFGMEEWVLDGAEVERAEFEERLRSLWRARKMVRDSLRPRAAQARAAADRNLEILVELTGRRSA